MVAEGSLKLDGEPHKVMMKVPVAGTYVFECDDSAAGWKIEVEAARPAVLLSNRGRRYLHLGQLQETFFYVPKGTKQVQYFWSGGPHKVLGPDRKAVAEVTASDEVMHCTGAGRGRRAGVVLHASRPRPPVVLQHPERAGRVAGLIPATEGVGDTRRAADPEELSRRAVIPRQIPARPIRAASLTPRGPGSTSTDPSPAGPAPRDFGCPPSGPRRAARRCGRRRTRRPARWESSSPAAPRPGRR